MRKFALSLIRFYQKTAFFHRPIFRALFLTDKVCRFTPTCSTYCYQAIQKYGIIGGLWKCLGRIVRCNPWNQGGKDPIK